jgi:hypothetical protein
MYYELELSSLESKVMMCKLVIGPVAHFNYANCCEYYVTFTSPIIGVLYINAYVSRYHRLPPLFHSFFFIRK